MPMLLAPNSAQELIAAAANPVSLTISREGNILRLSVTKRNLGLPVIHRLEASRQRIRRAIFAVFGSKSGKVPET